MLQDEEQDVMDDSGKTNQPHSSLQHPQHQDSGTQPSGACNTQTNTNSNTDGNQNTESMDVEDDDGWQVVRKGKKR